MKNSFVQFKNAVQTPFLLLLCFFFLLSLKSYAITVGGDEKDEEQTQVYQTDNEYMIVSNSNESTLFIKVFKKDIGGLIYYTGKGIQIYDALSKLFNRKSNNTDDVEGEDVCTTKFFLNFEAGFVGDYYGNTMNSNPAEQFLAISGHYNKLCVRFIWILTEV